MKFWTKFHGNPSDSCWIDRLTDINIRHFELGLLMNIEGRFHFLYSNKGDRLTAPLNLCHACCKNIILTFNLYSWRFLDRVATGIHVFVTSVAEKHRGIDVSSTFDMLFYWPWTHAAGDVSCLSVQILNKTDLWPDALLPCCYAVSDKTVFRTVNMSRLWLIEWMK